MVLLIVIPLLLLTACGTMERAPESVEKQPDLPRPGNWSLEFAGDCTGQEAEPILITHLDDEEIVFGDFRLLRAEDGQYRGSAIFIAPMPIDGREIPYEIAYVLSVTETGSFVGTETIIEGGGHGIACPIELIFVGAE